MAIKNVALIGANGKIGPHVLKALQDSETFKVTVLTRASSKSTYPSSVNQAKVGDDLPSDDLVKALQGQDALVMTFSGSMTDDSIKLIDAAQKAGVKRIIPADFGSCDSSDPRSLDLIPLYIEKKKVRDYLQKLISEGSSVTWTSIVCGHFFDFGLKSGLLSIHFSNKKAWVFDGGDIKWSATMLSSIGLAVVGVLKHEEETKNKMVYIQSINLTQNELLSAVEKYTGTKFDVQQVSSNDFKKERKQQLETKGFDHDAIEDLVSVEGIVNGNWETKENFVNDLLQLPKENLDDLVARTLS